MLSDLQAILIDGRADANSCGHAGCTPLHVAAQLDHVNNNAICKLLVRTILVQY